MRSMYYRLTADHAVEPRVEAPEDHEWMTPDWRVAEDKIVSSGRPWLTSEVSTVFLAINHSHTLTGPPVLFETMVFGGPLGGEQDRYHTWDEAVAGHAAMLARVRAAVIEVAAERQEVSDGDRDAAAE